MASSTDVEKQAEELLGARRVPAPELVAAIHAVNPTGGGLPAKVERRRYALKSKLQSRLILDFFEELSIHPVEGAPGVIGLRYRPQDRDACHAVLAELSLDARSRVQMHLDTAPAESVPAPLPRGRSTPRVARTGLLAEGRAALDEYDFERARGLFEEALEGEGDAAAVALLELHVDSLAAWEDALAVEAKLEARQLTPPVRALLALAAAHVGDAASCRRLSHELLGPRPALAFCVLAGQALRSGELLEAAQHLAEARARDGASAELIAVEKELARLKAAAREPAERALEALNAAGDLDGAVAAAEALLQRWPESGLARRVVRDAEARRDAGRVASLDARARHAFEAGEDEVALRLWGEAVELGAKGLEADVKRAAARLEARLKAERLSAVVERLREVSESSLRGYLELDDEERHSVRERVMDDALGWLELLQSSAQRSWVQDVAAVMALKGVLATSPPADVVVSLLRPFEAQVRKLEKGRAALSWAAAQLEQAAQQERAAQLEEARGALARGEPSAAIALAERHVEEAGQPGDEARAIVDEARRQLARSRLVERYHALMTARMHLEALQLVGAAERTEGEDVAAWALRRSEVSARLRQELAVEVSTTPGDLHAADFGFGLAPQEVSLGLDDEGAHFFWVAAAGRHLFVRKVSVAEQRVVEAVALVTPDALVFPSVHLDGERLWVTHDGGAALQLSVRTWEVLRWHGDAADAEVEVAEGAVLVPGGRFLWLSTRPPSGFDEVVRIIDLERDKVHRELGRESGRLECVITSAGARVFCSRFGKSGRIFTAAGLGETSVPEGVTALAASPVEDGLLGVRQPDGDDEEEGDVEPLSVVHLPASGALRTVEELSDSFNDAVFLVATSRAERTSFVTYEDVEHHQWLVGYGADEGVVKRAWRVPSSTRPLLLQDASASRACIAVPSSRDGLRCALLSDAPPLIEFETDGVETDELPQLSKASLCSPQWSPECGRHTEAIHRQTTPEARRKALAGAIEKYGEQPELLVQLARDLRRWHHAEEAAEATAVASLRFPDHPAVRLDVGEAATERGAWQAALEALDSVLPAALQKGASHLHHLRGMALFQLGRLVEAKAALVLAGQGEAPCRAVAGWPAWLDAMAAEGSGGATRATTLLALVRAADAALEAAESSKALALLDVASVWRCLDVQLAARLATAALDCAGHGARLRLRLIVATFLHLREAQYGAELPMGPLGWSAEKLAEVEKRVRGWLDGLSRQPAGPAGISGAGSAPKVVTASTTHPSDSEAD